MKLFNIFKRKNKNEVITVCDYDDNNPYINSLKNVKIYKSMQSYQYEDTVVFVPPVTCGKVIKVYDGDTITIASTLPFKKSPIYRFSVRIAGIDCPEIRTKNVNEKYCANLAKEFIHNLVNDKIVTLENIRTEKYGRILADVYCDGISLGEALLKEKLAVKYDGKTKSVPVNWVEFHLGDKHLPH